MNIIKSISLSAAALCCSCSLVSCGWFSFLSPSTEDYQQRELAELEAYYKKVDIYLLECKHEKSDKLDVLQSLEQEGSSIFNKPLYFNTEQSKQLRAQFLSRYEICLVKLGSGDTTRLSYVRDEMKRLKAVGISPEVHVVDKAAAAKKTGSSSSRKVSSRKDRLVIPRKKAKPTPAPKKAAAKKTTSAKVSPPKVEKSKRKPFEGFNW